MTPTPPDGISVPIQVYIDRCLEAQQRLFETARASDRQALDDARSAMEHRLMQMNEFRTQILEERRNYVDREILDAIVKDINGRVSLLKEWTDNIQGRITALSILVAVVGIAATVIALYRAFT